MTSSVIYHIINICPSPQASSLSIHFCLTNDRPTVLHKSIINNFFGQLMLDVVQSKVQSKEEIHASFLLNSINFYWDITSLAQQHSILTLRAGEMSKMLCIASKVKAIGIYYKENQHLLKLHHCLNLSPFHDFNSTA